MFIHLRIKSAVIMHAEVAECRPLIVDEKTSVLNGRLFGDHAVISRYHELFQLRRLNVEPVDKR